MISKIDLESCTACGICIDVCPTDVLRMDETIKKPVARYIENCMTCYVCEQECPSGSIFISPFKKQVPPVVPSGGEHD